MRAYVGSTVVHRMFALIIPITLVAWLVTPLTVVATPSLFALLALLTAFAWIVLTTYNNAQPAPSLAQAFHDGDRTSSTAHQGHPR